jgi:hypothetical protein
LRILITDQLAPPKQRHTAHRIWLRLCAEQPGFAVSERSVCGYVKRRRQQLGLIARESFVPQSYNWGVEGHVDWYEAWALIEGERIKLQVFAISVVPRVTRIVSRYDQSSSFRDPPTSR